MGLDGTKLDLSKGGAWHQDQETNPWTAIQGLPNADSQYEDGLEALRIHQQNYEGDKTIHRLQPTLMVGVFSQTLGGRPRWMSNELSNHAGQLR